MNALPLDFLNQLVPLSDVLKVRLNSILVSEAYKKKSFLLKEGQVCNRICFIEKGLIRIYYMKDGAEVCSGLLCEGGMAIAVKSFFKRELSDEFMQAIEDTIVHYITYDELEALYRDFP